MLDLNYVRENIEKVRAALQTRGVAPEALDHFAEAYAERGKTALRTFFGMKKCPEDDFRLTIRTSIQ